MLYANWYAIFWIGSVSLFFIGGYCLALWDQASRRPSRPRIVLNLVIGTLIVIATYADTLYHKDFEIKDFLLLALVAAHGWKAEDIVQGFINISASRLQKNNPDDS